MADFQSSLFAAEIETVLTGAITPNRGKPLTEAEKIQAREYIGASALGEGIKILAHFDTLDELKAAVPTPKAGDAYSVGVELPHRLYAYDFYHNEWHDYGPIRSDDITARLAQNLAVSTSAWVEDTTVFADYTYKASIPLGEITGNDFSIVAFSPSDASSGIFCPIAFAFDGYVEIWANKKPNAEIIIPAVTFIALGDTSETGNSTKGITNASGLITAESIIDALGYTPADAENMGVPDGSIGTPQLANGAVTQEKLADDIEFGITTTKLWENARPSNIFGDQTIQLDVYEYMGFEVQFYVWANAMIAVRCYRAPQYSNNGVNVAKLYASSVLGDLGNAAFGTRRITFADTSVHFEDCYTNSNAIENLHLVPFRIYGIKGVK